MYSCFNKLSQNTPQATKCSGPCQCTSYYLLKGILITRKVNQPLVGQFSSTCGELRGPFGPCWGPLAPSHFLPPHTPLPPVPLPPAEFFFFFFLPPFFYPPPPYTSKIH